MEKLINDFSFGLFFWQLLIFTVLVLVLVKFAWKPIMNAITAREEGIRKAIESAERAKEEMAQLKAENEVILKEARAERESILKEAKQIKDQMIADAKTEAEAEAVKVTEAASVAIQLEKTAALADIKSQAAQLSVAIAEALIQKELSTENKQDDLIKSLLNDVKLN